MRPIGDHNSGCFGICSRWPYRVNVRTERYAEWNKKYTQCAGPVVRYEYICLEHTKYSPQDEKKKRQLEKCYACGLLRKDQIFCFTKVLRYLFRAHAKSKWILLRDGLGAVVSPRSVDNNMTGMNNHLFPTSTSPSHISANGLTVAEEKEIIVSDFVL